MRSSVIIGLGSSLIMGACFTEPVDDPDGDPDIVAVARNAPTHSVSGGGRVDYDLEGLPEGYRETYGFSARQRPDGSVDGNLELHWDPPYDVAAHGDITCLNVQGNGAWIGFVITHTNQPESFPVGGESVFHVVDNGSGGNAPDDQVSFFFGAPAAVCGYLVGPPAELFDWTHGNVTVR